MHSGSDFVLDRWESIILHTLHVGRVHTWLWEVPPHLLRDDEISVCDADGTKLWCSVTVVGQHVAQVLRDIQAPHIIKNGLPLLPDVDVGTGLSHVVNVDVQCCARLEHQSCRAFRQSGMLKEVWPIQLLIPFVGIFVVVEI